MWLDLAASFFSALSGAFFGALCAFKFRKIEEKGKGEEKRIASLNKALFVLARQANNLMIIQKQIEPHRNEMSRAFNLPAKKPVGMERVSQDEESLFFMIENNGSELLFKMLVAQDKYYSALESVKMRTEFHFEHLQVALENSNIMDKSVSGEELQKAIGVRNFMTAIVLTDAVYEYVDDALENIQECSKNMYNFSKELFPGHGFIHLGEREEVAETIMEAK